MKRLFLVFVIFLAGCGYSPFGAKPHPPRVITSIEVVASTEGQLHRYRYTDDDKMRLVMQYLRHIRPQLSMSISPDTFRTDAFRITLNLSDGTQTVYHQLHSDYLQKDNGTWKSIDSAKGAALLRLLKELPSDG